MECALSVLDSFKVVMLSGEGNLMLDNILITDSYDFNKMFLSCNDLFLKMAILEFFNSCMIMGNTKCPLNLGFVRDQL